MFYIGVEIVFYDSCHGVQQITQLDLYMGLVAREELIVDGSVAVDFT